MQGRNCLKAATLNDQHDQEKVESSQRPWCQAIIITVEPL